MKLVGVALPLRRTGSATPRPRIKAADSSGEDNQGQRFKTQQGHECYDDKRSRGRDISQSMGDRFGGSDYAL
jgi:hypothetical protein